MSYEDYRRTQIEDGRLYQDFVVDVAWKAGLVFAQYSSRAYQIAVGESRGGIEIKHDKRFKETGNLCIETAEKARPRPGPYATSGIYRDDHWLYAIGDYDIIFLFPSKFLRALHTAPGNVDGLRYRRYQTDTSQGFLIPEADARKYAAKILQPNASGTVDQLTNDLEALARELYALANATPSQLTLFE